MSSHITRIRRISPFTIRSTKKAAWSTTSSNSIPTTSKRTFILSIRQSKKKRSTAAIHARKDGHQLWKCCIRHTSQNPIRWGNKNRIWVPFVICWGITVKILLIFYQPCDFVGLPSFCKDWRLGFLWRWCFHWIYWFADCVFCGNGLMLYHVYKGPRDVSVCEILLGFDLVFRFVLSFKELT